MRGKWHRRLAAHAFRGNGSKRRAPVALTPSLIVNDGEAGMDLALAGAGIAQAGLYHALPYLRTGRLKLVLTNHHDAGAREFVLHYPHRRHLAPPGACGGRSAARAFRGGR